MPTFLWLKGLLAQRSGRLFGAAGGVALTVALLAVLGAFLASSAAQMTARAIVDVPVDWQIEMAPGVDSQAIVTAIGQATPYTALEQVGYAAVEGLSAVEGGATQTTGPGKVLGIGPNYRQLFPAELRLLTGLADGVLIAQQTAANLHVAPGSTVSITRVGLPSVSVKIDGVVELPNADSLFQAIGMPAGTAPQAPPDNVLLLPSDQWHQLFDAQAAARPDSVHTQLHLRIAHALPAAPTDAYAYVLGLGNKVEALLAGSVVVGNNLAARLDGVRADALYARVVFLFLGLPGALLALLLTVAIAASGGRRRRREQALLRTRGASLAQILRLESSEALIVAGVGVTFGLFLAYLALRIFAPESDLFSTTARPWLAGALLGGLLLAFLAVLAPAWMQARHVTVAASRADIGRPGRAFWQPFYLDWLLLAVAGFTFWQSAGQGYQIVLAPEGVPQASVSYGALLAPLCLWLGICLLTMRIWLQLLDQGRRPMTALLSMAVPRALRGLAGVVAAFLSRQRMRLVNGIVLVALAFSFAVGTAVFNTTYNAQARVDAELTNGADVTVTGSTAAPPSQLLAELTALPGVAATQPMQHRYAYVGNDLQDLYGIDPLHIGEATDIANAYFAGGSAQSMLSALANQADGVLVSAETVQDYQLNVGDQLNLRLQNASDHQYHVVPFHFLGVVREFPTAPSDSFLVANARYVAQQSGTDVAEVVLLRSTGDPIALANAARSLVSTLPGIKVQDIGATQRAIGSSLTSIDLHGLTCLELAFAVLLVAGATGLVLALGLAERKRTLAILVALGAHSKQLGLFLWSEALLILVAGGVVGTALGFAIAQMLVKVLTGVFDPPPEVLAIPWVYLALLLVAALGSTALAVVGAQLVSRQAVVEALREI